MSLSLYNGSFVQLMFEPNLLTGKEPKILSVRKRTLVMLLFVTLGGLWIGGILASLVTAVCLIF